MEIKKERRRRVNKELNYVIIYIVEIYVYYQTHAFLYIDKKQFYNKYYIFFY